MNKFIFLTPKFLIYSHLNSSYFNILLFLLLPFFYYTLQILNIWRELKNRNAWSARIYLIRFVHVSWLKYELNFNKTTLAKCTFYEILKLSHGFLRVENVKVHFIHFQRLSIVLNFVWLEVKIHNLLKSSV